MEADEYMLMDQAEEAMWWYRAMHAQAADALAAERPGDASAARPGDASAARPGDTPAARTLDAGCGTGGFLRRAALPGAMGLEYNAQAARRAAGKSGAPVAAGSVNAMPFAAGSFAAIASLDVLCHAGAEPRAMLAECHRVLAPGGRLVLNLPALPWLSSAHDARVHTVRRYTAASIRTELEAAGFIAVRPRYWNALLLPLMILQRKVLARGADAASDVGAFPPWLDAMLFAATRIERAAMRLGLNFPVGGSLIVTATRP